MIFSTDGGQTWIAPAADHGFLVDNCYGYGKAFELPDGDLVIGRSGHGRARYQGCEEHVLAMPPGPHSPGPFRH